MSSNALPASAVLLAALLVAAPLRSQDMADVIVETVPVSGSTWMLTGRGGNVGVSSGPDGVLLVDDQFEPLAPKIRAAATALAGEDAIVFVLNTHWHGDHTGGNVAFGEEAVIVAHENVRKRLGTAQQSFGRTIGPQPDVALPVVTFSDGLSIHFNGEELRVRHFPEAHTDGDAVIHFTGSNAWHLGDLFFAGRFPYVDLDHGGSVLGLIEAIESLLDEIPASDPIIPGHGPLSTRDDLAKYHRMLEESVRLVRQRRGRGLDLAAIQAEGMPARYDGWGEGFIDTDRWLAIVDRSLDLAGESRGTQTGRTRRRELGR